MDWPRHRGRVRERYARDAGKTNSSELRTLSSVVPVPSTQGIESLCYAFKIYYHVLKFILKKLWTKLGSGR